jgi:hypothetical protein
MRRSSVPLLLKSRPVNPANSSLAHNRSRLSRIRWSIRFSVLTTALLLAGLSAAVHAAGFPGTEGIPVPPSSQASFESWLSAVGRPVASRYHGYKANYTVYRDYKMLVYGTSSQVPDNRYDSKTGQNSCLGFSYDELTVTNSQFRDDAPGGVTQTTPWQWKELSMGQSARISWARLSDREKQFIKSATLTYRNNSYGGMTFSALGLSDTTTVVLAPPSWHLGFALYTTHYRPGSTSDLRYATFNGKGAGSLSLAGSITVQNPAAPDGAYVIGSLEDHIDLNYVLQGSIAAFQGLAASQDIKSRGVGNNSGWVLGSGNGPWQKPLTWVIRREDLAGKASQTYKLQGQVWAVSHMGDIHLYPFEKTIVVRAEAVAPPFIVQADLTGFIHYFSGQTDSQGRTMPLQQHRFLGLEKIKLKIDLTRDPSRIAWTFQGKTAQITGIAGQKHYEANLVMPFGASTVNWNHQRLGPPLTLKIEAWDRSTPAVRTELVIQDIDRTGSVYDISYVQIR